MTGGIAMNLRKRPSDVRITQSGKPIQSVGRQRFKVAANDMATPAQLALVAQNLSNAAIARRLYLCSKTVDHHASAILTKLGIASRREVADAARKLGIELVADKRATTALAAERRI